MRKIPIGIIVFLFIFTSCASIKESVWTGIGTGAATGAASGSMFYKKNRGKGALTGALVGAVIGGISSYFIHQSISKRDARVRRETLFNLDKFNVSSPTDLSLDGHHGLTMPTVDSQWVDTEVNGKKLVEGHRIWRIVEDPQWIPAKSTKRKRRK